MSEFTEHNKDRALKLTNYMMGLIEGEPGTDLLSKYNIKETTFMPNDILFLFDELYSRNIPVKKIKTASNRLFNILYEDLMGYKKYDYPGNSIIGYLIKDNAAVRQHLAETKNYIKQINKAQTPELMGKLLAAFEKLEKFSLHYTVKENIVFPEIEKKWDQYQCLKLMWSFHDDIRKNIKKTIEVLKESEFHLKLFNEVCGKVYFNINTIIFREENVLFPIMYETMEPEIFNRMLSQLIDFGLPFVEIEEGADSVAPAGSIKMDNEKTVRFPTGELTLKQIEMVFNHLPVDITFVDENDKVRYFSSPEERIFPRTVGIIGRNVQDCHPHESVGVVGRIVDSFKSGERNDASFWLRMGSMYVLIKYFAVRDYEGNYQGVLEVSQEISDIKKLEGENRLLDWE
ncbi:MAG: PAS domain-containing protein [Spirochaetales bacterium]|uniref:PAS domain-containing protein n=1 Tax=Candidatus Thalassospirochaeta sargassi TaxID=3119039 RepID=A0AAJ1I9Z5_9SPIO|nr:PAS domain-containing protein [Spirochaetales bacterium]